MVFFLPVVVKINQEKHAKIYILLKHFYGIIFLHPYRQSTEETDVSDSSDAEDRERLGDKVFSLVEELDPLHANDITGELRLKTHADFFSLN